MRRTRSLEFCAFWMELGPDPWKSDAMIPRILASRVALLFYLGQTMLMTLAIVVEYISALLANTWGINLAEMFDDSDTVGILLIATGVLLECRETLLKRALREEKKDDSQLHLSVADEDLEYYGVVLLILGLTMELIVAITKHLDDHVKAAFYQAVQYSFHAFTFWVLTVLMLAGVFVLLRVVWFTFVPRPKAIRS